MSYHKWNFLIIDGSSDFLTGIDSRFGEIFTIVHEKVFLGLPVMTVTGLLQLPPVRGKVIFSRFSDKGNMKHILGLQLLHLFKYAELSEGKIVNCLLTCLINFQ